MPKVSVIVPIYGVEKYIERCVNCLFQQTMDSIEFIYIDDCTPDRSLELLKAKVDEYRPRFAEMNWEVRIVRMPANSGLPAVRRHGIKLATGDFIIHCDSDDWVDPNYCKRMYEKAIEDNADIVICDFYKADAINKERILGCYSTNQSQFIIDLFTEKVNWSVWNKLIKTTLYRHNNIVFPHNNMGEDMALIFQLVFYSNKISYVPEPLYYYFFNPQSITHVASEKKIYTNYQQLLANTDIVISFLESNGLYTLYEKYIDSLKFNVKKSLLSLVKKSYYRSVWKSTYLEINSKILSNPCVNIKEKIKYILTYLRMYP